MSPLIKIVIEEIRKSCKKQPLACGFNPGDNAYEPLKLMQTVMAKTNEVCLRYLDNSMLCSLPSPDVVYNITSVYAVRNKRKKMEDRHVIVNDLNTMFSIQEASPSSYYAIFDGHAGHDAAAYSSAHLHQYLAENKYFISNPKQALQDAFCKTDALFIDKCRVESLCSGTTAVCALLRPKEKLLYIAWVGDSQALLVKQRKILQCVNPHKPDRKDERDRIEKNGGCVMLWGTWRVNGQLAVSRAIGDPSYKPFVTAEPEVAEYQLDGLEDFLILACDGLWDHVSEGEAAQAVYTKLIENPDDTARISNFLVQLAKIQGSCDNISVIVVFLKDPSKIAAEARWANRFESNMDAGLDNANNPFTNSNGTPNDNILKNDDLLFNITGNFKQNGTDSTGQDDFFNLEKPNGKRSAEFDDDDDFGPETDVDAVDDVLLSPMMTNVTKTIAENTNNNPLDLFKSFGEEQEKSAMEIDHDLQKQQSSEFDGARSPREETPTPPADAVHDVSGLDNAAESDSEDEWNYIKGDEANKENDSPTQPDSQVADSAEEDNMSQLNPNAAEFVPVSPTRSIPSPACRNILNDEIISQSPKRPNKDLDVNLPDAQDFEKEIKSRPSEVDSYSNGHGDDENKGLASDLMENLLNGKNIDEIPEFHPGSTPTKITPSEEFHFGPNAAPFTPVKLLDQSEAALSTKAVYGDESVATLGTSFNESITSHDNTDFLVSNKESDPMSMSFYEGKEGDNPFDLNQVHLLPENIDEFLSKSDEKLPEKSNEITINNDETIQITDLDKIVDDEKELASPVSQEDDISEGVCELPKSPEGDKESNPMSTPFSEDKEEPFDHNQGHLLLENIDVILSKSDEKQPENSNEITINNDETIQTDLHKIVDDEKELAFPVSQEDKFSEDVCKLPKSPEPVLNIVEEPVIQVEATIEQNELSVACDNTESLSPAAPLSPALSSHVNDLLEADSPEIEAKLSELEAKSSELEAKSPEPETTSPEPEAKPRELEVKLPEQGSEAKTPEPELHLPESEQNLPALEPKSPELEVRTPEPELKSPEPELLPETADDIRETVSPVCDVRESKSPISDLSESKSPECDLLESKSAAECDIPKSKSPLLCNMPEATSPLVCDIPESNSCDLSESKSPVPELERLCDSPAGALSPKSEEVISPEPQAPSTEPEAQTHEEILQQEVVVSHEEISVASPTEQEEKHDIPKSEICEKPLESPHEDITSSVKDDISSPTSPQPEPIVEDKIVVEDSFVQEHTSVTETVKEPIEQFSADFSSPVHEAPIPETCPISTPMSTTDINSFLERSLLPELQSPLSSTQLDSTFGISLSNDDTLDFTGSLSKCVYPLPTENIVVKTENIAPEFAEPTVVTPSETSEAPSTPLVEAPVKEETCVLPKKVEEVKEVAAVAAAPVLASAAEKKAAPKPKSLGSTTKKAPSKTATTSTTKPSPKPPVAKTTTSRLTGVPPKTSTAPKVGLSKSTTAAAPKPAVPKAAPRPKPATTTSTTTKSAEKKPLTNGDAAKPPASRTLRKSVGDTINKPAPSAARPATAGAPRTSLTKTAAPPRPTTAPKTTQARTSATTRLGLTKTSSGVTANKTTSTVKTTVTKTATSPKTATAPKPRPPVSSTLSKPRVPLTKTITKAPDAEKKNKESANKLTASRVTSTTTSGTASRTTTVRKTEVTKNLGNRTTLTKTTTTTTKSSPLGKKPAEITRNITKTKTTKVEKPKENGVPAVVTEEISIVNNVINESEQLIKDNSPIDNKLIVENLLIEANNTD